MHYVRDRGRYLGFVVHPGRGLSPSTKAQTLSLMDSLRVTRRRR